MNHLWEPMSGRYFAIVHVESPDGEPIALFARKGDADAEIARRRALPVDHDDHFTEHHQAFPADIAGHWWNSYDPAPEAVS